LSLLDIMEEDCEIIDTALLPLDAFTRPRLAKISGIALPQGSPFIAKTSSMQKILKKSPAIYR